MSMVRHQVGTKLSEVQTQKQKRPDVRDESGQISGWGSRI